MATLFIGPTELNKLASLYRESLLLNPPATTAEKIKAKKLLLKLGCRPLPQETRHRSLKPQLRHGITQLPSKELNNQ